MMTARIQFTAKPGNSELSGISDTLHMWNMCIILFLCRWSVKWPVRASVMFMMSTKMGGPGTVL